MSDRQVSSTMGVSGMDSLGGKRSTGQCPSEFPDLLNLRLAVVVGNLDLKIQLRVKGQFAVHSRAITSRQGSSQNWENPPGIFWRRPFAGSQKRVISSR